MCWVILKNGYRFLREKSLLRLLIFVCHCPVAGAVCGHASRKRSLQLTQRGQPSNGAAKPLPPASSTTPGTAARIQMRNPSCHKHSSACTQSYSQTLALIKHHDSSIRFFTACTMRFMQHAGLDFGHTCLECRVFMVWNPAIQMHALPPCRNKPWSIRTP